MQKMKEKLLRHPKLKSFFHSLLMSKSGSCPRWWVKHLLNPFILDIHKGSVIRRSSIMNVIFFNRFQLGKNSVIDHFAVVDNGVGDIIIGDNVRIGINNTLIGPVTIGNNVIIGQHVVISGLNHRYQDTTISIREQGFETRNITIGEDGWIGSNSTIVAGITIGKHVVIGAGSVVTRDIPDFCVAAGNPAKIIKRYNPETRNWIR